MPRGIGRHNFIVIPSYQNVNGHTTEEQAVKGAAQKCRDRGGREEYYIYKLCKVVAPKAAPVEVQEVSL